MVAKPLERLSNDVKKVIVDFGHLIVGSGEYNTLQMSLSYSGQLAPPSTVRSSASRRRLTPAP